jgi:polar amino acid transport system substrate-binding protein
MTVAIKTLDPFVKDSPEPRGFSIELMDALAKRLGRPVVYERYETVGDILKAVEAGQADAAIAGISITAERERSVDFSTPMFESGLQILGRAEGTRRSFFDSISDVFSSDLLKFVGFLFALIWIGGIVMYFSDRLDEERSYRTVWDAAWVSALNLVSVGNAGRVPRKPFTKFMAVVWMLTGLFIGAQFTATLSAGLTVDELRSEIDGPEDLVGAKVVSIAETTSSAFLDGRDINSTKAESFAAALKLLKDRQADALVFDSPVVRYAALQDDSLRLLGARFSPQFYGIAVERGSALREEIDRALLELREEGFFDELVERWFGRS